MSVDILAFDVIKGAENVSGKLLERYADTTFSKGYPTGGYTFPKALNEQYGQLGIANLIGLERIASNTAAVTFFPIWDYVAETLVVVDDSSGTEVADNTDLSTLTVRLKFIGTR